MDDIVIEFKLRLSGLSYDEAAAMRNLLRDQGDMSTLAIVDELRVLAQHVAPAATIECYAPWAEWRPAQGKRKGHMS